MTNKGELLSGTSKLVPPGAQGQPQSNGVDPAPEDPAPARARKKHASTMDIVKISDLLREHLIAGVAGTCEYRGDVRQPTRGRQRPHQTVGGALQQAGRGVRVRTSYLTVETGGPNPRRVQLVTAHLRMTNHLGERTPMKKEKTVADTVVHDIGESMVTHATTIIESFKQKFEENPCHALEWSQSTFQAAARLEIGTTLRDWALEDPKTIVDWLHRELLQRARFPERSSSQQANVMHIEKTAAIAYALQELERKV